MRKLILLLVICIKITGYVYCDNAKVLDGISLSRVLPCRIVCIGPYSAEILCDLGEAGRIAAVAGIPKDGAYDKYLKNKPVIGSQYGGNINLEMLLSVNPDLVFCVGGTAEILTSKGISVYVTKTYDIEGIMGFITDIGKIVRKEKEAKNIVDKMKARIQNVEMKVKNAPKRPLVYFEQNSLGKTRAKGSLTHELITRAGGINIAGNEPVPFPVLSQEFIIQKNPDIIIVEDWGTKQFDINDRQAWKNIKAVKAGRIFHSKSYYTGYTSRCIDGLEAYARYFYPELFK